MTILEMSLGGAVLIAVILLLRRLALHRLPKWTFLLLWAVALCRLLAPVTLPSRLSVYTGAARAVQLLEETEKVPDAPVETPLPSGEFPTGIYPGISWEDGWTIPTVPTPAPEPETEPVSLLAAVYWTGASLCGLFFTAAYLWSLRRFWEAEPVESEFLRRWQEEHHTLFRVAIRTCAAINAPLAYGLVRPVVLLPENTDWTDENQLTCVLTHEYVHIRRGTCSGSCCSPRPCASTGSTPWSGRCTSGPIRTWSWPATSGWSGFWAWKTGRGTLTPF